MTRLSVSARSRRALCASAAFAIVLAGMMQGGVAHAAALLPG